MDDFRLQWPTADHTITQPFGARPQYYRMFGLPGHEGLDLRAPTGSEIRSAAGGIVIHVGWRYKNDPYGYHIRIKHVHGERIYTTIYAHLVDGCAEVKVNDEVLAGQVIGIADSTGNVQGAHLHFGLKRAGATQRGETSFPYDIVDPTPYLPALADSPGELENVEVPDAPKPPEVEQAHEEDR